MGRDDPRPEQEDRIRCPENQNSQFAVELRQDLLIIKLKLVKGVSHRCIVALLDLRQASVFSSILRSRPILSVVGDVKRVTGARMCCSNMRATETSL